MQFETMRPAEVFDEALVGVGLFSAELMVDVRDGEHDAQFAAQLQQQEQERDRVRAARDSGGDAVSGLDQGLLADCFEQLRR